MLQPLRKVAVVSAAVALAAFIVALVVTSASPQAAIDAAARAGICFTAVTIFWAYYEKFGWKQGILRLGGWLSPYPDLGGRWEGKVQRDGEETSRPFVIEVRQSYTKISFRTFSTHSRGGSEHAFLTSDETGTIFGLVAIWQTTTRRLDNPSTEEMFRGTSVWSISFEDKDGEIGDQLHIVDRYYTAREPKTSGKIDVTRVSKKLKNAF